MAEQTKAERETHLSMTGDDHTLWEMFTDDPYWIRRIEKLSIEPIRAVGEGFVYHLRDDQVLLRKGKRQVSEATRQAMALRLQNSRTTESFDGQNTNGVRSTVGSVRPAIVDN